MHLEADVEISDSQITNSYQNKKTAKKENDEENVEDVVLRKYLHIK